MIETRTDAGARVPEPFRTEEVRRVLLDHYDRTRRALPWRGETDPYRIWVSEVMLQQTRVETVVPYYRAWLERFPDLGSLAAAELDEVLVRWEGLGYYRRARHLHAGAAYVRDRHGGHLPASRDALRAVPGIGEYTAAAVASIAFGEAAGAVDGNVKRVLARLFDEPDPTAAWLRGHADALVDPERPGDWNQAMMDLGATVCGSRSPACDACPLGRWCVARAEGTATDRPRRRPRPGVSSATYAVAVVVDRDGRTLLVRRPPDGLLAGLWAFPDAELEGGRVDGADRPRRGAEADDVGVAAAARTAAREAGVEPDATPGAVLDVVRHRFTHLDARYVPVLMSGSGGDRPDTRWLPLEDPRGVALPVAQRRIAAIALAHHREGESRRHADP